MKFGIETDNDISDNEIKEELSSLIEQIPNISNRIEFEELKNPQQISTETQTETQNTQENQNQNQIIPPLTRLRNSQNEYSENSNLSKNKEEEL